MAKDWIKGAIKKPGALRATAKKHGGLKKDGDIKSSFLDKATEGKFGKLTEKRAHLAETLKSLRKR